MSDKIKSKKGLFSFLGTPKSVIVSTVLIDVIGMGVIIPVLPFYVESFGVSSFTITLLFSVFAFCSFISGPFLGALSDRIGRRPVLILSIMSSALGWFVFASAKSVWVLFLGRIVDGMAAGNFPIAQSYMVDLSKSKEERTSNLGLIGAVFGIGFIVGPIIGAALSSISPVLPFWFVGVLATINLVRAYFYLPETLKHKVVGKKLHINPFVPVMRAVKDKELRSRYAAWLLFGTAFAGMQSIFALFTKEVFGFSPAVTGYLFTATGAILVLNQGFALKKIWLNNFKESDLEIWFFLVMIVGFILMDLKILILFGIGILLTTIGQSTLRAVMSSSVAGAAGDSKRGEVMGIMASIMSVSMIIGPLAAGSLFQMNVAYPYILNIVVLFAAFVIMKKCCTDKKLVETEPVEVVA